MPQKIPDVALGEPYYQRFIENDPFSPRLRAFTEKVFPMVFRRVVGPLEVNTDDERVRDGSVRIWTFNHRAEALDVDSVMEICAELDAPTIRPVMKAPHGTSWYTPFFHAEGGVAVGRGSSDKDHLLITMAHLASKGFSPAYFNEGFRVKKLDRDGNPQNTRLIHGVKPGAITLSLKTGLEYVPGAIAGAADDDERSRHIPIVAQIATPLSPEDFHRFDYPVTEMSRAALEAQQDALDRAYIIRDAKVHSSIPR